MGRDRLANVSFSAGIRLNDGTTSFPMFVTSNSRQEGAEPAIKQGCS